MKTLIFVRHGKSSWEFNVSDENRPLKSRGITDANTVSKHLKTKEIAIDFLYSSPANRAFSTCKIFVKNLNISGNKLKICEELYDFEGKNVLNFIKNMDDTLNTVVLFGHNYAFTALINSLGDQFIDNLPTSGVVEIEFAAEHWAFIKHGHTKRVLFPRDFKS